MTSPLRIFPLSHHDILQRLPELVDILVDSVNGGASVSFMQPFHPDKAGADVAKLLVHSRGRRQGIARQLMSALELEATAHGKSVLVLDTATGSGAEGLYQQCGWQKVGEIPRYALMPDGEMTATSVYYKFV